MKKSILISGIGGSGKSTLARVLKDRGYTTYDLEEISGMFRMIHIDTGEETSDFDNDNLEMVKTHEWNINKERLANLIHSQTSGIAFYCGIASNQDAIIDLFSKVIILVATPEEIRHRLSLRKKGEYGHDPAVIDLELGWKDWWEDKAKANGAIVVNGENELQVIIDEVLAISLSD